MIDIDDPATAAIHRTGDARAILAWFQSGQREPVSIDIDDDEIRVCLDVERVTYPFDGDGSQELAVVVYGGDLWLGIIPVAEYIESRGVDEAQAEQLASDIQDAMAQLAAFAYGIAAAGVRELNRADSPADPVCPHCAVTLTCPSCGLEPSDPGPVDVTDYGL